MLIVVGNASVSFSVGNFSIGVYRCLTNDSAVRLK